MKIVRVVGIVLAILFWIAYIVVASPKSKKVKVYLDAPVEVGRNEEFSLYLMEQMRLADWDNESYEFEWVKRAMEAEFIISIVADRNRLPVMVKTEPNTYTTCYQFVLTVHLWKKNSPKTHEMLNQQLDCDPNEMARRAVEALEVSMGLKPVVASK